MGAKRKVNEQLYKRIKKELNTPKDDKKVMKKYKLGQTAVRAIRRSWCYADYLSRTSHKKNHSYLSLPQGRSDRLAQAQAFMAWRGFMILIFVGAFIVLALLIRWILSWFGI